MLKIFIGILLSTLLYANTLESSYKSQSGVFYSSDIYPNIDIKFEVIKVPDGKSHIRESAKSIMKIFELYGYNLTPITSYVDFYKDTQGDFLELKHELQKKLLDRYSSIEIESISIVPRGKEVKLDKNSRAHFSEAIYTNPRGTFYVTDANGVRRYLDYHIKATINSLYSSTKISRNEPLGITNATLKRVAFTNSRDIYIDTFPSESMRFKSTLKPFTQIHYKNLEPAPLVHRNSKVTVLIKDGSVLAEFYAIATQEGSLYDIITVQKSDKKRLKARVIGENLVELE